MAKNSFPRKPERNAIYKDVPERKNRAAAKEEDDSRQNILPHFRPAVRKRKKTPNAQTCWGILTTSSTNILDSLRVGADWCSLGQAAKPEKKHIIMHQKNGFENWLRGPKKLADVVSSRFKTVESSRRQRLPAFVNKKWTEAYALMPVEETPTAVNRRMEI